MRQSSLEAHEYIKPQKETHYELIIETLKRIGKGTSKIIAKNCRLSYHAVARRLPEMKEEGKVMIIGNDETQRFKPIVWSLKESQ